MGLIKFIMGFESTYHWEDPIYTGVVFGAVMATLISICYYSLISVCAYTSLFILMAVAGLKLYTYVMVTFLKKETANPIAKYTGMDVTIAPERVNEIANKATSKLNSGIVELRRLFLVENMMDSIKFGLSLWVLTYIGSWFNAMTLIILSWVGLFTIPKIYLNNKAQIDPVLDQVNGKLDEVSEKVFAMIPKGKAAAEKKEE
jgi:hypothetical protein